MSPPCVLLPSVLPPKEKALVCVGAGADVVVVLNEKVGFDAVACEVGGKLKSEDIMRCDSERLKTKR